MPQSALPAAALAHFLKGGTNRHFLGSATAPVVNVIPSVVSLGAGGVSLN